MPPADQFCGFEVANNPTLTEKNPLGVKGVREAGTIAAIPAVMNAVNDAGTDRRWNRRGPGDPGKTVAGDPFGAARHGLNITAVGIGQITRGSSRGTSLSGASSRADAQPPVAPGGETAATVLHGRSCHASGCPYRRDPAASLTRPFRSRAIKISS